MVEVQRNPELRVWGTGMRGESGVPDTFTFSFTNAKSRQKATFNNLF